MWPFFRSRGRADQAPPPPESFTEAGRVIRMSESRQGGSAARTVIHLVILTDEGNLRVFQDSPGFTMLPLTDVDDRVEFTWEYDGNGHSKLTGFGINFSAIQATEEFGDETDKSVRFARGKVIRKAESFQGGDAARTQIHLAVEIYTDNVRSGRVITFQAQGGFTYLPLCQEGDTVELTYWLISGHVQLQTFEITEESLRAPAENPR